MRHNCISDFEEDPLFIFTSKFWAHDDETFILNTYVLRFIRVLGIDSDFFRILSIVMSEDSKILRAHVVHRIGANRISG